MSKLSASAVNELASAGSTPDIANQVMVIGNTRAPQRSMSRPVVRIARSAPSPIISGATPSSPSVTFAASPTAGSTAPQAPQNAPKAGKLASARRRSLPAVAKLGLLISGRVVLSGLDQPNLGDWAAARRANFPLAWSNRVGELAINE